MNEQNLSRLHEEYLEPPIDRFFCEDWQGAEIFEDEEYIQFDNTGDKVLLHKENVLEYLSYHYEFTLELLDNVAIRKAAGE